MLIALLLAVIASAQEPSDPQKSAQVTLKAGLGPCSTDFIVKDAKGNPAYAATIHTRVRYGLMSIKRMDLEVSTGPDGKARVEGLPSKAKPITYDVDMNGQKAKVEQNVATSCQAVYAVALK